MLGTMLKGNGGNGAYLMYGNTIFLYIEAGLE